MTWILIFAMGAIVFLNRYAFLEPRLPLRLSSNARQFLGFAVPGMLTAICGPIIFMPDHQLTSQHLLYGLSMRPVLSSQPLRWRLGLGFLLTDEFFALTSQYDQQQFNRWYALGVGLTFYVAWNLFTLAGILLGQNIPHLDQLGLDFSIVATFVALIAPLVRNLPTVVCVAVSLFCSVLFSHWHWETALVVAGLLGMSAGFICQKFAGARA